MHFDQIGYDVSAKVLDSRYFGVSQTRTRCSLSVCVMMSLVKLV